MQGGTGVEYMCRVQAVMCTSQRCCGHYIVHDHPHDLCRAAVDKTSAYRALEVAQEDVQVVVRDKVQMDWRRHKTQGSDGGSTSLDAQDPLATHVEPASHDHPPGWDVPLDSYQ